MDCICGCHKKVKKSQAVEIAESCGEARGRETAAQEIAAFLRLLTESTGSPDPAAYADIIEERWGK